MKLHTLSSVLLSAVLTTNIAIAADDTKTTEAAKVTEVAETTEATTETTEVTTETTETVSGKEVYQTYCIACHVSEGMPTIAPPIFAVKNHVTAEYPEREDFVKRVADWVKAPNADDVLMPGAVRKFGLMPAMPQLSDEQAQAVAEFLFDSDMELPDWYAKHYEEEHGEAPKAQ